MLALNYYKIDEDIKNRVLGSYFYHSLKDAVMRNRRKKKSQLVKVKQQLKESEIKKYCKYIKVFAFHKNLSFHVQ